MLAGCNDWIPADIGVPKEGGNTLVSRKNKQSQMVQMVHRTIHPFHVSSAAISVSVSKFAFLMHYPTNPHPPIDFEYIIFHPFTHRYHLYYSSMYRNPLSRARNLLYYIATCSTLLNLVL